MNIDQDNYRMYSDKKRLLFRMNETEPEQINHEDLPIYNDININIENKRKIE